MRYLSKLAILVAAACMIGSAAKAAPEVWDIAADWSTTTNDSHNWTQGILIARGAGDYYAWYDTNATDQYGLNYWYVNGWLDPTPIAPRNLINYSGSAQFGIGAGQAALIPYFDGHGRHNEAFIRWTAPKAGVYDVNFEFFGGGAGETAASVYVKGASVWNTPTTSNNPVYTSQLALAQGDFIDIYSAVTTQQAGITPLNATIVEAVPEPSSVIALIGGLSGLGLITRKRK